MKIVPPIGAADAATTASAQGQNRKISGAAHDFEALLVTQMLRSSRGDGGWMGTGDDQADDAALGFGEEEFAQALANSGGLGLAKLVEQGLAKRTSGAESS